MKIIKIDESTYCLLLLYFFSGMFMEGILIFVIVLFHELGHVFSLKALNKNVKSVIIYPFGGITKYDDLINSNILFDFFIAVSGILFQIILFFIFLFLVKHGFIRNFTYELFCTYNLYIFLFNLLPIIPLDGSKIVECFFYKILSFKFVYILNGFISIVFLFIFCILFLELALNYIVLISFLGYKIYFHFKNKDIIFNKFLLERVINKIEFKLNVYKENCCLDSLAKEKRCFFKKESNYIDELEVIKDKFKL